MPTHPECLYYLYKGYTHGVYNMRERNQNPPVVYMEGLYSKRVSVVGDIRYTTKIDLSGRPFFYCHYQTRQRFFLLLLLLLLSLRHFLFITNPINSLAFNSFESMTFSCTIV